MTVRALLRLGSAALVVVALGGSGPPFNNFSDQGGGLFHEDYLRAEKNRILKLCEETPLTLIEGAPEQSPPFGSDTKLWHQARCLELWLVRQVAIHEDRDAAQRMEQQFSELRAAWRDFWTAYYAKNHYRLLVPHRPDQEWLPRYITLLKDWIDESYVQIYP